MFENIQPYPNPKPATIVRANVRSMTEDEHGNAKYGEYSDGFIKIPQGGKIVKIATEPKN